MTSYQKTIREADLNPTIHIMKRSGERCEFDRMKIQRAIEKANDSMDMENDRIPPEEIEAIVLKITRRVEKAPRELSVEEIQDMVENYLMMSGKANLARAYIIYRYTHNQVRNKNTLDKRIESIINADSDDTRQENSNKNPTVVSVQRDYIAGEYSRYYTKKYLLPEDIKQAHDEGIIHFHDSDYFIQSEHNCELINLEDMLQNGTRISGTLIEPPKSFATACTITSQIIAQVASHQYGGQTISISHIAPFVNISRQKYYKRFRKEFEEAGIQYTQEQLDAVVKQELQKEIESGCQTIQYQLITLQTTNGQAPFVTVFMYLNEVPEGPLRDDLANIIEIMLTQRMNGIKNEFGTYLPPAFPKLIYVLQENNISEDSKYWYLTTLAAKCSTRALVPDYISEKKMLELKGDVYPCMGCRSFLTPDRFTKNGIGNIANAKNWEPDEHKYYGRFNSGVVSISLPDVACSANGNETEFWKILDERLELCHRALQIRHERLRKTPSDFAPIQFQDGAVARLKPGETIDKLLYDGYSTISLGYAGLAECVYRMKGVSHMSKEGMPFGLAVMQRLNDACAKWKAEENIDYSVYGTPLESTTYKFAKALQKRFGIIPGVSDKNFITNSYHIKVSEPIDAFEKLTIEAKYQELSPGGAVSYVELPNMSDNIEGVLEIIKHMYETILYAEINVKRDYCEICGYEHEMRIVEEGNRLLWECPNCGNRDENTLQVIRRTCGYVGTQFWNQGRTQEIRERVLHVDLDHPATKE